MGVSGERFLIGGREAVCVAAAGPVPRGTVARAREINIIDAEHVELIYENGACQILRLERGHFIQDPETGLMQGSEPGPDHGGGDGGGEHPGHGYSESAKLVGGVIHTDNVHDAARALYEGKKVELNQPREVSTLIEHLGKVAAGWAKLGGEAPRFNLCNVSVKGTNLFCAESKGIPRIEMPQMDDDQTKKFRKSLEKEGYTITKTTERADHLRA